MTTNKRTPEEIKQMRLDNLARGRATIQSKKALKSTLLQETKPLTPSGVKPTGEVVASEINIPSESKSGNGNGHTPPTMIAGNIPNPFTQHEGKTAIDSLINPGKADELEGLLIRGDFPDKPSEGDIMVVAVAVQYADYEEYHCDWGKRMLRNRIAGQPGINGKRISQVVDAIVGERRQKREEGMGGFTNKLGELASRPFGGGGNKMEGES